jgi:hypothetical protein
LFPTELFTRLDVNKTQMPSILKGGAAGTVNMRSTRPFDNPGAHFTYQLQEGYAEIGRNFSPRGGCKEYINYYNLNPGMHYQPLSWVGVDFQLNRSVSTYGNSCIAARTGAEAPSR